MKYLFLQKRKKMSMDKDEVSVACSETWRNDHWHGCLFVRNGQSSYLIGEPQDGQSMGLRIRARVGLSAVSLRC